MNPLTTFRMDVAETLTGAGLTAHWNVPERPTPPFVAVTPYAPYVTDGPQFKGSTIAVNIRCIGKPGTADAEAEAMEDTICAVLAALLPYNFSISVGQPGYMTVGNADYPATDITVTTQIFITEGGV